MKEQSYNGHLEKCVCKKCHEAREILKALIQPYQYYYKDPRGSSS